MEDYKKIKVWKIIIYFIIYSVIGFCMETVYAIFTKGMLESRKSFLYGPFCAIYGIAAISMICLLDSHKESPIKIFVFGSIVGLIIEYVSSFLGEILFYARWWDYSNNAFNINGRICGFYAFVWGILSLIFIYKVHPKMEKIFDFLKFKNNMTKTIKIITIILLFFIFLDATITSYAVKAFIYNISLNYDIDIRNLEKTDLKENFFTKYFSNEKMIMIYPNISVITKDNKVLYLGSVLHHYKNYYYDFKK